MQSVNSIHDSGAERAKARVGRRALWGYGLLTLAILIPGIVLRLLGPIVDATAVSPMRLALQSALEPISFGSGPRFWLGVAGTTMMALLLLYPLRKRLGRARLTGSVGGWFHIHLALGLIGPALVLYHANFGFGSFNANVALWSVAIVLASGLVALTIYLAASERMARARDTSAGSLDDILSILRPPGHHDLAGTRLIEDIRTLHGRIEEHKGLLPSPALRREVKALANESARYVHDVSLRAGASQAEANQMAAGFRSRLIETFTTARRAARSAAFERTARLWRLLHLPVIAVGAIATTLHVYAVWGVEDEPALPEPPPIIAPLPAPPPPQAAVRRAQPAKTVEIAGVRKSPLATKASEPPREQTEVAAATERPAEPQLQQGPLPATRSRPALPASTPQVSNDVVASAPVEPSPKAIKVPPPESPKPVIRSAPPPAPSTATKSPRSDDGAAVVAELQRRNDANPIRVGDLGGLTLAAKIAQLKNSNFDHGKTNFPLTGKHKQVRCENCHTRTLIDTPRDCLSCHKRDDVHRGRRPDCARCHTTNRWSEIIRRR